MRINKLELRIMRIIFILLSAFMLNSLFFLLSSSSVSAHMLKTDQGIGAVIHIDPEDDPIAGEVSNIYFEFKDKEGKFKASECECQFIVKKDGQQIFSTALFEGNSEPNLSSSAVSFTFPERNIYQIQVVGKPKTEGGFNSFTLNYDIRVERQSEGLSGSSVGEIPPTKESSFFIDHIIHFFVGGVGIVVVVLVLFYSRKRGSTH